MKVGVYDRYWSTGGGGEKFAAGIAAALRAEHEVDLLAHEPVDLGWLGERLHLDLDGLKVAEVPDHAGGVTAASAGYDVFVNASFRSGDPNRAARGLYVVHFPGPPPSRLERARHRVAASTAGSGGASIVFDEGFYLPEASRRLPMRWTAGAATLRVTAERPGRVPVVVLLARVLPQAVTPMTVEATVDGSTVGRAVVDTPTSRLDRRRLVPLRFAVDVAPDRPVTVTLSSPAWVPADAGVGADRRRLGAAVAGAHVGGGWRGAVGAATARIGGPGDGLDFLDSYDRVLANSTFTQAWTERMWHRPAGILYPPVTQMAPGAKEPIVLSVGRFFLPGSGHNKKQVEMVRAFRQLRASAGAAAEGWTYHLVGGCAPEHAGYLDQIRAEAAGLPVVLHPDASGGELAELYARASIFWHAAGLGEDPDRHPDRYEHFGITTVEAMSASAVPVVIDGAGQAEIVDHGRSGYRFPDLDGLVAHTRGLLDDPAARERMASAARRRAADFAWEPFVARVAAEAAGTP